MIYFVIFQLNISVTVKCLNLIEENWSNFHGQLLLLVVDLDLLFRYYFSWTKTSLLRWLTIHAISTNCFDITLTILDLINMVNNFQIEKRMRLSFRSVCRWNIKWVSFTIQLSMDAWCFASFTFACPQFSWCWREGWSRTCLWNVSLSIEQNW